MSKNNNNYYAVRDGRETGVFTDCHNDHRAFSSRSDAERYVGGDNSVVPDSGKHYGVAAGRETGVRASWGDTKPLVDGYSRAVHQSFKSEGQAHQFVKDYAAPRK